MKKNRIRLTESQLHRVIKESVKRVLSEMSSDDADRNINDMIPNLDGDRFQNMPKDKQNSLSWNSIDNAYDVHLDDLMAGEPYDNDNPFTWNNGPAAIGDEPIGFRQAMRPEYWRNRGVDGKFEDGYINGGIGEYNPQLDGDISALSNDDKFGYTNLSETIKRAVRKVLSEGRNDELYEWFMNLIANQAQQLYALGSLEDAKATIENRIKHSTLSPNKKQQYLYGGYDFNGIMGAKDMNMLAKIIAQIGMAGTGYGLRGTGRINRFNR